MTHERSSTARGLGLGCRDFVHENRSRQDGPATKKGTIYRALTKEGLTSGAAVRRPYKGKMGESNSRLGTGFQIRMRATGDKELRSKKAGRRDFSLRLLAAGRLEMTGNGMGS